ncbi:MAG: hypothetical protein ACI31R_03095 [Bacilli bacterium]
MKIKQFKEKYTKEPKKQDKKKNKEADTKWLLTITIISFIISFCLSLISELIIPNTFIAVSIFLVLMFIFIGVIFDAIGLSVATADDKIFHSMATKKVNGAKQAIKLINQKDKVSSFLNDVIGDICGVVSGSCGLAISIKLATLIGINTVIVTIITTSIISALTIGGKAFGKTIAINNANEILFEFSKFLSVFQRNK